MLLHNDANKAQIKGIRFYVLIGLCILLVRLLYLQIVLQHNFIDKGRKNFLRTETIKAPRGNILDCTGKLLATNKPLSAIYWCGSGKSKLIRSQLDDIAQLYTIFDEAYEPILKAIQHAEKTKTEILLRSNIDTRLLSTIAECFPDHATIKVVTSYERYYPYKNAACHILGHIGKLNVQTVGKMGLEKLFNQELLGKDGKIIKVIDAMGSHLEKHQLHEALSGKDIRTTLDMDLQLLAEKHFPSKYAGAVIIMDPQTGALKTIVSRPDFDPGMFLEPIAPLAWESLQQGRPFINRAFNAAYPPASLFKIITMCAALETGIIHEHETIHCAGHVHFKGRNYHCARRHGHGEISIVESIAKSCNTPFYVIGTKIDIDTLATYAYKLGLGTITGSCFPEHPGLIPTKEWKLYEKGERWWPGETLSAVIGQSFMLTTPIQVARMISGVIEGYLVKPRILCDERIDQQPIDIQDKTRKFLKKCLKSVIRIGTGKKIDIIKDLKVYAKTGTAQTSELKYRKSGPQCLEHAWFMGYFKYKNSSPLVIVMLIEHAITSQVATTYAKNFLQDYRLLMQNLDTQRHVAERA